MGLPFAGIAENGSFVGGSIEKLNSAVRIAKTTWLEQLQSYLLHSE